ncbi:MAG: hypothetical protein J6586_01275 [Snodgrassella sp.]|nr:hypothetical protein [Snodgrassella sp.]
MNRWRIKHKIILYGLIPSKPLGIRDEQTAYCLISGVRAKLDTRNTNARDGITATRTA